MCSERVVETAGMWFAFCRKFGSMAGEKKATEFPAMLASCMRSFFVQVLVAGTCSAPKVRQHLNVQLCVGVACETRYDCHIRILAVVNYCLLAFFYSGSILCASIYLCKCVAAALMRLTPF